MPDKRTNPAKQNLPRKVFDYRKYLTPIVLTMNGILILADVLMLAILPQRSKGIVVTRSEIFAQQLQAQSAQKLITDLSATKPQQEKIEKALPNEEKLLEVIQFLESLKEISQVKSFNFVSDTPVKDASGFSFLPLSLTFEGSLPQAMAALTRLEKSPYLFTVDATRIESPSGISEGSTIQVALRLYVSEPFAKD